MGTILLIILIIILIGALPTWPYSSGWGYYPSGGIGLVLLILIVLLLMGRLLAARASSPAGARRNTSRRSFSGRPEPHRVRGVVLVGIAGLRMHQDVEPPRFSTSQGTSRGNSETANAIWYIEVGCGPDRLVMPAPELDRRNRPDRLAQALRVGPGRGIVIDMRMIAADRRRIGKTFRHPAAPRPSGLFGKGRAPSPEGALHQDDVNPAAEFEPDRFNMPIWVNPSASCSRIEATVSRPPITATIWR